MASGWAGDDAVQEQIDSSIADAIEQARRQLPRGESLLLCQQCGNEIPPARRAAVQGVRLCIGCQRENDQQAVQSVGYNRRGSKDSQLR
jgi:phage/conjugal plasmid C-4 type zinc finger TraR family protein